MKLIGKKLHNTLEQNILFYKKPLKKQSKYIKKKNKILNKFKNKPMLFIKNINIIKTKIEKYNFKLNFGTQRPVALKLLTGVLLRFNYKLNKIIMKLLHKYLIRFVWNNTKNLKNYLEISIFKIFNYFAKNIALLGYYIS